MRKKENWFSEKRERKKSLREAEKGSWIIDEEQSDFNNENIEVISFPSAAQQELSCLPPTPSASWASKSNQAALYLILIFAWQPKKLQSCYVIVVSCRDTSQWDWNSICDYCDVYSLRVVCRWDDGVCMCQVNNLCLHVNEFSSQFADKVIYFGKKVSFSHRSSSFCVFRGRDGRGERERKCPITIICPRCRKHSWKLGFC